MAELAANTSANADDEADWHHIHKDASQNMDATASEGGSRAGQVDVSDASDRQEQKAAAASDQQPTETESHVQRDEQLQACVAGPEAASQSAADWSMEGAWSAVKQVSTAVHYAKHDIIAVRLHRQVEPDHICIEQHVLPSMCAR